MTAVAGTAWLRNPHSGHLHANRVTILLVNRFNVPVLSVCATMVRMDEMIRQIRAASDAGLYYLALLGVLTLSDICAGLASEDGKTSGAKYKAWLRDHVPEQAGQADLIYGLRCSLLHQGRAFPHGGHFPLAFTAPGTGQLHNVSTVVGDEQIGWISIPIFVDEVTRGAETWLRRYEDTATVKRNLEKFARLRPEGLPPHVAGPVIA